MDPMHFPLVRYNIHCPACFAQGEEQQGVEEESAPPKQGMSNVHCAANVLSRLFALDRPAIYISF
jgi:hypothetical protein